MYSTVPLSIQCICGSAHAPALIRHNRELLSMSAFMQQSMLGHLGKFSQILNLVLDCLLLLEKIVC